MCVGFKKSVAGGNIVSLPVEDKLLVESAFKVLNAKEILITVEIACKPETSGNPVIFKQIEYSEPRKDIYPGLKYGEPPL